MTEAGMDAVLLLHPRDVLYYAGTARPAALLVTAHDAILFVRRGFEYARREAAVSHVERMNGFASISETVAELGLTNGVLGTELDVVSAQLYQRLAEVFPAWVLADVSRLVLGQRRVKDRNEVFATRGAARVADAGHSVVPRAARPGISELALAAEVEAGMRRAGHEGYQPLRDPGARGGGVLLMSGENLAVRGGHGLVVTGGGLSAGTPYGPSRRVLEPGDTVVLDIGSTWAGYTADEARTFVIGPATEAQQSLFQVTLAAEDAVLDAVRPGVAVADLYGIAESVVAGGAPPAFAPGTLALPGFVGHGVGLELDEPPLLWPSEETHVQVGMVLAVEIEVSAPTHGLMVKLEDTVLVGPEDCELLTRAPRELIECH